MAEAVPRGRDWNQSPAATSACTRDLCLDGLRLAYAGQLQEQPLWIGTARRFNGIDRWLAPIAPLHGWRGGGGFMIVGADERSEASSAGVTHGQQLADHPDWL